MQLYHLMVREELEPGGVEPEIEAAFLEGWLQSRAKDPSETECPPHLGHGEWSTILAARAQTGDVLLLLDDRLARREARAFGLRFAGTAAIVGLAQWQGLIASARSVFEQLLQSDFRIAPQVISAVLEELEPTGD